MADGVFEDLGPIRGPEDVELRSVAGGRVFVFPAALKSSSIYSIFGDRRVSNVDHLCGLLELLAFLRHGGSVTGFLSLEVPGNHVIWPEAYAA